MQRQRRSYPKSFKIQVVDECAQPGTSVASVALRHGLNASMLHKWIRKQQSVLPGFIPIPLVPALPPTQSQGGSAIQIDIPHHAGNLAVRWPASDPEGCARFLRGLLK